MTIFHPLKMAAAVLLLAIFTLPSWATINYTEAQRKTAIELIKQLEARHYANLEYDDLLSSRHLDSYLNSLDRDRLFLLASDIEEFEKYRNIMDDQLPEGNLSAGFFIFNRFHERLASRLERLIASLPYTVAAMDFELEESYLVDTHGLAWAQDQSELDERFRKRLKDQVLRLKLAEKAPEEIAPALAKRYNNKLNRVRQYNNQDVFQIYANALAKLYDPHTSYLSPRRAENFNINMSLSLEGIGAVLRLEDEYTKVARLVANGPADKQGELRPSDRIVGIGQGEEGEIEDVIGWRLDEVVELIRGPRDSTVRLEVIPAKSKAMDQRKVITIVRNKIKLEEQSAQKEVLEMPNGDQTLKVGIIDIPAFYIDFEAQRRGDKDYNSTSRDVKKLLQELQEEGIDGIIVDLRNNGGGSLREANELTGLFIEYGPTVQIRHSSQRVWRNRKILKSEFYEGPLVVLINRRSASASEIFAGAIQDYQRGLIVGDQSFGKGTVQTMIPLTLGQLKITESKFYRISGESTQHRGVLPDVVFPSLYDPEEIGESSLDHALNWDQIDPVKHRRYDNLTLVVPKLTAQFQARSASDPDLIYLEELIELVHKTRDTKALPLNEEARVALRESQKNKALNIENRRRKAKGEDLLASVDHGGPEKDSEEASAQSAANDYEERDVLLTEACNVLMDSLTLKQ